MRNILIFIILILAGCQVNDKRKQPAPSSKTIVAPTYQENISAHIKNLKTEKDTTFLNFILGSSRIQTLKHLNQLIKEGKTSEKKEIIITMLGASMRLAGYPYTLYFEDGSQMKGLFDINYLDGKLFKIDLQLYEKFDLSKVVNLINQKYGHFDHFIASDGSYHWLENNTEIIAAGTGMGDIQYFDLKKKYEYENLLKDTKKEIKKIGQKNTKSDL